MTSKHQRPQTILVVDDHPQNLQLLSQVLLAKGWEILVATDGEMALEQAEYAQPDLILLDVMMPNLDGFETCRRLKASPALQEIPVIFMTALDETTDRLRGFAVGGVDYILKPYQPEEVLARIEVHLQLRNLTKELAEKNAQLSEKNAALQQEIYHRQRTEAALRESQQQLAAIATNIPGGVFRFIFHDDGRYSCPFASEGYRTLLEIDPAHLQTNPETLFEMVHPDDLPVYTQVAAAAIAGKLTSFQGEVRYRLPSGKTKWVATTAQFTCLANGDVVTDGIDIDITDRKQLEEALRQREAFLNGIFNGVEMAISVVDVEPDGTLRWVDCNPACSKLTGIDMHAMRGKPLDALAHFLEPPALETTYTHYQQCIETGEPIQFEVKAVVPNQEQWWLTCQTPLKDETGRVYRLVSTSIPITARKRTEAQLTAQNELLSRIARGEALSEVFLALIQQVEHHLDDALCSVLLLNEENRLYHGAAPSLPQTYVQAIDGIHIGADVGSCGTAAFLKQTVIVSDIATDPLWQPFKAAALDAGLRACWSSPILSSDHRVLGTVVVYYREARSPQPHELAMIEAIATIAKIGIEKERAEAELKTSEERYRLLSEVSPVGIFRNDLQGNCIYANAKTLEITGLSLAENLGTGWSQHLHPEDREQMVAIWSEFVQRSQRGEAAQYHVEHRYCYPDGRMKWAIAQAVPEYDAAGELVGFVGSVMDITDRKQAELEVQRQKEQLQAIASNLPGYLYRGIVLPDGTLCLTYLSAGAEHFYGIPAATLAADPSLMQDSIHPEDRPKIDAAIAQGVRSLTPISLEFRIQTPDRGWRWLHIISQVHRDVRGNTVFDGVCLDIHARKQLELQRQQSEAALRASESRFRELAETVREGFFVVETEPFAYTYVNPAYETITGFSAATTYADCNHWLDSIHPQDRDRVLAARQRELQGEIFDQEYRIIRPDGTVCWVRSQAYPVFDETGRVVRVVGTVADVSDRKATEAQVQASLAEKVTLLAEIHHRVKNNLQIISSLLHLQAYKIDDPQVRKALEDSWTRIDSMALVHETLYHSQDFSHINFAEYLETLSQNLFHTYNTHPDQIHLEIQADRAIALKLNYAIPCGLIVNELITNALKHAFQVNAAPLDRGTLAIQLTRTSADQIQLSVANSGDTLPPDFNPYTARSMGLQLVINLVNQLEGTLVVTRGDRTVFTITFNPNLDDAEDAD